MTLSLHNARTGYPSIGSHMPVANLHIEQPLIEQIVYRLVDRICAYLRRQQPKIEPKIESRIEPAVVSNPSPLSLQLTVQIFSSVSRFLSDPHQWIYSAMYLIPADVEKDSQELQIVVKPQTSPKNIYAKYALHFRLLQQESLEKSEPVFCITEEGSDTNFSRLLFTLSELKGHQMASL